MVLQIKTFEINEHPGLTNFIYIFLDYGDSDKVILQATVGSVDTFDKCNGIQTDISTPITLPPNFGSYVQLPTDQTKFHCYLIYRTKSFYNVYNTHTNSMSTLDSPEFEFGKHI